MFNILCLGLVIIGLAEYNQQEFKWFFAEDDQIKQIISAGDPQQKYKQYEGVLAELQNGTYAIYCIQILSLLVNNQFKPKLDTIQKIYYKPEKGERCFEFTLNNLQDIDIFCYDEQFLRQKNIQDLQIKWQAELNYTDQIQTMKIRHRSTQMFLFFNLHLSNWKISVFNIFLTYPNHFQIDIIDSQQYDWKIKKILINNQDNIYILSNDKVVYELQTQNSEPYLTIFQNNNELIDIDIFENRLFLLTKLNNQCSVNEINNHSFHSFGCSDNELQLMLLDQENFYLIQNQTMIISPFTNVTYQLEEIYYIIPELRLLISCGTNMSIILLEQRIPTHPMQNQQLPISYEWNDVFFDSNHYLVFGKLEKIIVLDLTPFLKNHPFSVKVLADEFDIIDQMDLPDEYEIFLNSTDEYQFIKMVSDKQFIYSINNTVYYAKCYERKIIFLQELRQNQQQINFFLIIPYETRVEIYFDDLEGKELHHYYIPYLSSLDLKVSQLKKIIFKSSIQLIKYNFDQVTIFHEDLSKTILAYFWKFSNDILFKENMLFKKYQYILKVHDYILCTQNHIQLQIQLILYIESNFNFIIHLL